MTQTLTTEQVALLTSADVDRMSSDEYLSNLKSNPAFATRVNELAVNEKRKPR